MIGLANPDNTGDKLVLQIYRLFFMSISLIKIMQSMCQLNMTCYIVDTISFWLLACRSESKNIKIYLIHTMLFLILSLTINSFLHILDLY